MATTSSKFNPISGLGKLLTSLRNKGKKDSDHPQIFEETRESQQAFESIKRGTSLVPIDKIVGSVGRYNDFDSKFRLKPHAGGERFLAIKKAMGQGKTFPPIALYQIKDDYFILDGHHRYTAAKELGRSEIKATILELLPSRDSLENRLYIEKIEFRDKARLAATITLTEPGQYRYLQAQIHEHQGYLAAEREQEISYQQAAQDWFLTIYKPLVALIKKSGLIQSFKDRTVDDLYLYISLHQWSKGKKRKYGIGIDNLIPRDMEEFRKKMAKHTEQEYPEMKRQISVFILMNVDGKHELRIIDKLLELDEVREVHSVHGSIDIIVKVTLSRDLLSSDAELLSQFVQSTIRKWRGVISTQTLLPGLSKNKDAPR